MKLDKEFIKKVALRELQYNIADPVEATLRGVKAWLVVNELKITLDLPCQCELESMAKEYSKKKVYSGVVCRGSWVLGNNCKVCERCIETKPK